MDDPKVQARKTLPVVCFNSADELTVADYIAKAKKITGADVVLANSDVHKLEHALRVFKGMAAVASKQREGVEER